MEGKKLHQIKFDSLSTKSKRKARVLRKATETAVEGQVTEHVIANGNILIV